MCPRPPNKRTDTHTYAHTTTNMRCVEVWRDARNVSYVLHAIHIYTVHASYSNMFMLYSGVSLSVSVYILRQSTQNIAFQHGTRLYTLYSPLASEQPTSIVCVDECVAAACLCVYLCAYRMYVCRSTKQQHLIASRTRAYAIDGNRDGEARQ